jgi:hypothetical protein
MIEQHPLMQTPADDQRVWRYMDFTKLVSMLDSSSLFFCRLDRLDDKYEGSYPQLAMKRVTDPAHLHLMKRQRVSVFVNCWHINEYESAAMWRLYLKTNEGIAVQSTYKRLCESLSTWPFPLYASHVSYIDYNTDTFPTNNGFYPVLHKRKSFAHESELRLIYDHGVTEAAKLEDSPVTKSDIAFAIPPRPDFGVSIPIELSKMVERVFVAPTASMWFRDLVAAMLRRYALEVEVIQSDLDSDPVG